MARHIEYHGEGGRVPRAQRGGGRVHHPLALAPGPALAPALIRAAAARSCPSSCKAGATPAPLHRGLALFSHLANIGDAKSLVIHPATTTHFRMDDAALAAAGITPGTVRYRSASSTRRPHRGPGRRLHASQK
jgi:O-acetylhomoserine (thiol)-lyase